MLRELQEKENENLLTIFLRNKSLAESVFETQELLDFNNGLTLEVADLRRLHEERSQKFDEISVSKQEQESENYNLRNRKLIVEEQKTERRNLLALNKKQEKIISKGLRNWKNNRPKLIRKSKKLKLNYGRE